MKYYQNLEENTEDDKIEIIDEDGQKTEIDMVPVVIPGVPV